MIVRGLGSVPRALNISVFVCATTESSGPANLFACAEWTARHVERLALCTSPKLERIGGSRMAYRETSKSV